MAPIWIGVAFQNADANAAMVQAGNSLKDLFIFTPDFMWNLAGLTGSGVCGSLMILALISKSKRFRAIGKLNFIPSFFGIGEPVIFGIPIVYNTVMLIPWILSSMVAATIGWYSIKLGLLNPFILVSPYTPIPIGGVIATADFRFILVGAVIIIACLLVYLPFFRVVEARAVKLEQEENPSVKNSLDDLDIDI